MKKNIIITGGTKGIGLALVEKFCSEGYHVITCSRSQKDLEDLKQKMTQKFGDDCLYIHQADLSDKNSRNEFIQSIQSNYSAIDVIINNTGIFIPGQIQNEEDGVFEKLMQTNLSSAYYLTRAILPIMIRDKKGSIFNICSTASITPYTNGGSYCISKYALYGMTKVLREELKPHRIKVTAVLPGATLTDSWNGVDLPESRFIKATEIAETIFNVYRLSDNTVVEEILIRPMEGDIA